MTAKFTLSTEPTVYVWECDINEGGLRLYYAADRKIPNAFHRLMQRLVLGFKWKKL